MEKLLNSYDKDFMKMAMLKHEETFKEQVYELHRLYRIQKIMMNNLSNWNRKQELRNSKKNDTINNNNPVKQSSRLLMKLDLERPADQYIGESNGDHDDDDDDEGNGNGNGNEDDDHEEVQLTLGPSCYYKHGTQRNKKPETSPLNSDCGPTFSSSSTGSSNIIRQEERLKKPPWIYQVLSFNMTS